MELSSKSLQSSAQSANVVMAVTVAESEFNESHHSHDVTYFQDVSLHINLTETTLMPFKSGGNDPLDSEDALRADRTFISLCFI
jgi:hypothetical protein